MLKLYFSKGSCSLSPHIALCESGLDFELIEAPTKTHRLADGTDYYTINPLGYVPLLVMESGETLREGSVIVQYIAERAPAGKLAPAWGTPERWRMMEWLNFIATEIHRGFSPLFNPNQPEAAKAIFAKKLLERYQWVDAQLASRDFLLGKNFSVADGYLFAVTNWAPMLKLDLLTLAQLQAFMQRMRARPSVQAAMKAEGML